MMRLRRFVPSVALACSIVVPTLWTSSAFAQAADAATSPAGEMSAADGMQPSAGVSTDLKETVNNFWHYARIARYELADRELQKILALGEDQNLKILQTFQQVAAEHQNDLDEWLLIFQGADKLHKPVASLMTRLNQARDAQAQDPVYIKSLIDRLDTERGYANVLPRLRRVGELAYTFMLDDLRDPSKKNLHAPIRQAMRDLGRTGLNPLVAATEMKDADLLISVIQTLGDLGYPAAVPYLARLAHDSARPQSVRSAAAAALSRMGAGEADTLKPAKLFYDLAEKLYYNKASITADPRQPVAYVWHWDADKGLLKKDVPSAIFADLMSMRETRTALALDPKMSDAISLWLAANYKRQAELPQGATDAVYNGNPSPHFYGVSAGAQYLNAVLDRALNDHNPAVALLTIKSLQQIVGQSNLFSGSQAAPIIAALQYPDRLVRFEAALTLAAALPQKPFPQQQRVVPILAEAVAQTGKPNVLLLAPSDQVKTLSGELKNAGYGVEADSTAKGLLSRSRALPAVDVIIVSADLPRSEIDQLFAMAHGTAHLQGAGFVAIAGPGNELATKAVLTPGKTTDQLKTAINEARKRSGSLPLDEKLATEYALRAAHLLGELAISGTTPFDLSAARETLLASLNDPRPDLVKAVAGVLAHLNSKEIQGGLLAKASDAKTSNDLRIALYKALATNAKTFGNELENDQIQTLQQVVKSEKDADVRSAAAEARGALNLSSNEARTLIVETQIQ